MPVTAWIAAAPLLALGPTRAAAERAAQLRARLIPIVSPEQTRIGVRVSNDGVIPARAVTVGLRLAPPLVRAGRVAEVMPLVPPGRQRLPEILEPGEEATVELPCPLRPGPVYRRAFGLEDGDGDDARYALPLDTMMQVELEWQERGRWRPFGRPVRCRQLVIVRGRTPGDCPHP